MSLVPVLALILLVCNSLAWAKKNESYTGPCMKSVSSAIARTDGADPLFPDFVTHWWEKNAKNYPGVCLSSKPNPSARNYLMVFSNSQRYYSGLMPTTHTYTSTSSTMLSANGSVGDQSGNTWLYTATGEAQTTTTTTVHENVPYTDRVAGLFMKTYDSTGRIIRSDGHLYRSRTGGDASNTLGYNIGSALTNINARGKMLKSALLAITRDQDAPLLTRPPEEAKIKTVSTQSPPVTVSTGEATAEISSAPSGADIEIDGTFVGSTPSSVGIVAGEHTLRVSRNGYRLWERTLKSSTGSIKVVATLEPIPVDSSGTSQTAEVRQDSSSSLRSEPAHSLPSAAVVATATSIRESVPPEETLIGVSCEGNPTVRHDGVEVSAVLKGPADDVDIKPGDVILAIDGHFLYTIDELRAELLRHQAGERLSIQFRHGRFVSENYLTLGPRDAAPRR